IGKNLADHPLFANYFSVNSTQTFDAIFRNQTLFGQLLGEWMTEKEGLFVDASANTVGFLRFPNSFLASQHQPDPSAGPLSAHGEM
ncbi:GMC oxidoreductase, partial [Sphaerobolus stellatus SS14]